MRSSAKRSSPIFFAAMVILSVVAPARADTGDRDYPIAYTQALPKLAGVRVPVLLPSAVLGYASEPFKTYVFVSDVERDHYRIAMWMRPGCDEATVCRFAHMEAGRPGKKPLRGERIRLERWGVTAYFTLGRCGFGCADSTLAFDRNGWRYSLGIKGSTKQYLIHEAATLRLFRAPSGKLRPAHTITGAERRARTYRKILETAH